MNKNDEFIVEIEDMSVEGAGIGRGSRQADRYGCQARVHKCMAKRTEATSHLALYLA